MAIYNIILFGLFLTAICEILFCIESKRKRNIFSFWVVILILFKGLRWDTGTDWSQYYSVFNDADWNNIFSFWRYGIYSSYLEPGYVFINVIIKTFFPYYTFFLLITNIFILYAYTKIIWKYLPNYQLVALAILAVSTELFPVRQTLTFAILCLSFEYILNRDFKKYLLCCIVCFAIHRSSLLFVPLYWVLNFNFKLKQSIVIYICTIISINFMYKLFDLFNSSDLLISLTGGITQTYNATNENYQSEQDEYNFSSALISYINALVQLSFFAYTNNQLKKSLHLKRFVPPLNLCLNCYLVLICLNAIAMHPGFMSLNRITNALWPIYPICITLTVYTFLRSKKYVIALGIFTISFMIKYSNLPIHQQDPLKNTYFVPYKSFLQQNEPIRSMPWRY